MTPAETILIGIIFFMGLVLLVLLAALVLRNWRNNRDRRRGYTTHTIRAPRPGTVFPQGRGIASPVTHNASDDLLTHNLLFHTDHNAFDGHHHHSHDHDSSFDSGGFDSGGSDGGGDCGGGDGGGD